MPTQPLKILSNMSYAAATAMSSISKPSFVVKGVTLELSEFEITKNLKLTRGKCVCLNTPQNTIEDIKRRPVPFPN